MDGIVIINKEKGYTSNDVVRLVKKILGGKVGHTGTLDPNATGVLPLLLGNGTKVSKYLINHDKEYEAVLQLGKKTTTADGEGEVIESKLIDEFIWSKEYIEKILKTFIGKQEQIPPKYSAIKVNGKKLYEYARKGQEVEIKSRQIEIYNISLVDIDKEKKQISFNVKCSKGTYIRTLCEDIAVKLNTVGYMRELNRISVGQFSIENAITLKELENLVHKRDFKMIIKIEDLLDFPKIELYKNDFSKYMNGVKINLNANNGPYKMYLDGKFIGIGIIQDKKLKRDLVV